MEKRTCVTCSREFTLTDSEISFYKSKGLELPLRCKACRDARRQTKARASATAAHRTVSRAARNIRRAEAVGLLLLALALYLYLSGGSISPVIPAAAGAGITAVAFFASLVRRARINAEVASVMHKYRYSFRTANNFITHYRKHGGEVGASNADEYLKMANAVIESRESLKKHKKEDNDTVIFNPATRGIVFLSGDGKIRSFFTSDRAYFDRQ